jgi:hypothetical protein
MYSVSRWADLTDANLTWASLRHAILSDATVVRTNFDRVVLAVTTFAFVDFSTALNLDTVRHAQPSTIGVDSIVLSRARLPLTFLRGAGVPEQFITYAQSLVEEPLAFYSCFISYSHADRVFARRLHDRLQENGVRCWLDEKQLLPGHDIYDEVDRAIRIRDKVLLCCSENSLTSWWVDNEIGTALEKEQRLSTEQGNRACTIIPLNLDGYLFRDEWRSGYRAQVRRRVAADFTGWKRQKSKFEREFAKLMVALQSGESVEDTRL